MKYSYVIWFLAALNMSSVVISFRTNNWSVFIWSLVSEIILVFTALAFMRLR